MSLTTLNLGKRLEPALLSGHPWVYRNHLPKHQLKTGYWVRLEAGQASSIGLFEEDGAIAVRLFSDSVLPDRTFMQERVQDAVALRSLIKPDTTAYRLINGENDGLPAIIVDVYERFLVVKTYAKSVETLLDDLVFALSKEMKPKGIVWRTADGLSALWGELPPPELTIKENGLSFIANLYDGQKTGLFLDQRDNRQVVRELAKDRTVLNLFSYNGAFSIYALAGGAISATNIDIAAAANKDAVRNAALNGFDETVHEAVTADVFEVLQSYVKQNQKFDMVILDPPSLAQDKKSKYAALRAYKKLNLLAMQLVNDGGLLISSSCTSQVFPDDFKSMLAEVAKDLKLRTQIIHEAGHALDHAVALNFPEGRYLKFVAIRVLT